MKLENILVVADKPKHNQVAITRGLAIAANSQAKSLHIAGFTYHSSYDQTGIFRSEQRREIKAALMEREREFLTAQVSERQRPEGVSIKTSAIWSKAIHAWINAQSGNYDLIVKTAHRSRTLTHVPTDWHLLRESSAPVLLALKVRWPRRPVVVASLDFSRKDRAHKLLNERVLEAGVALANLHGAELHACFVIETSEVLADLDIIDPKSHARSVRDEIHDSAVKLLDRFDVPAHHLHTPTGKVGHEVNSLASRLNAQCIVIGTTARTGIKGAVIGNSAERVLAKAHTDVLALKVA